MMTTLYSFIDSLGFTFDSSKIEFVGGTARLKNQRPENAVHYSPFSQNLNANWANGNKIGSAVGGAVIANGLLDLKGNTVKYIEYSGFSGAGVQAGCVRMKYKPNYSGNPASNKAIFGLHKTGSTTINTINLFHQSTGFRLMVYTSAGVLAFDSTAFGSWSCVAGTTYELEFNYDFTSGATRLFINGVQQGSTIANTLTRNSETTNFRIGQTALGSYNSDAEISEVVVFSTVQHVANYTPGYTMPVADFITGEKIVVTSSLNTNEIFSVASTIVNETGTEYLKYTLKIDGVEKYHNGTAWVTSNGYLQSNTISEINSNLETLEIIGFAQLIIYFISVNGTATAEISEFSIEYEFEPPAVQVETINVFGYLLNQDGSPDIGSRVHIHLKSPTQSGTANAQINSLVAIKTVDSDGAWQADLIPSNDLGGVKYVFEFYSSNTKKYWRVEKTVQGSIQVPFEDLT
jgi:hypothetical protein